MEYNKDNKGFNKCYDKDNKYNCTYNTDFNSWYNSIKRWENDKNMKRELLIRDKVRNESLEELKYFKPKINTTYTIKSSKAKDNKSKIINNESSFHPIINKNYKFTRKNEGELKRIEEKMKKFQLYLEEHK